MIEFQFRCYWSSGDLTINANRKNILLIRDINGQKEFARLDLTDPGVFASPYYYLKQNDSCLC